VRRLALRSVVTSVTLAVGGMKAATLTPVAIGSETSVALSSTSFEETVMETLKAPPF